MFGISESVVPLTRYLAYEHDSPITYICCYIKLPTHPAAYETKLDYSDSLPDLFIPRWSSIVVARDVTPEEVSVLRSYCGAYGVRVAYINASPQTAQGVCLSVCARMFV